MYYPVNEGKMYRIAVNSNVIHSKVLFYDYKELLFQMYPIYEIYIMESLIWRKHDTKWIFITHLLYIKV
ncbi:unnamed protein product [Schistosoma curassoni]|uniref:Tudor domain-containing protein n=1 Tax=Schistosoma curassoni TaxID=6186 RepID=A0A183KKU4_9TREM|nr:unnamed protein product [Schistosoma curassoni]